MNLIVETDIGLDPDDFFALLYLFASGVSIRTITVSLGDPDQIALLRFLLKELDLDIPVGVDMLDRNKKSLTGFHGALMDKPKLIKRKILICNKLNSVLFTHIVKVVKKSYFSQSPFALWEKGFRIEG